MPTNNVRRLLPAGIDPSRDSLGIAFLHPDQDTVLAEMTCSNRSLLDAKKLLVTAYKLAARFKTHPAFVLEATNVFWRPLASWLKAQGETVHVVSSRQTHANRSSGMRKTKTDFIDAAIIARLYQQGKSAPPYLPEEPYMSMRELSRLNAFLVDLRGMLCNRVYSILYQIHPAWDDIFCHPFTKASLQLMRQECVHPARLAEISDYELALSLTKASHGHQGMVFAQGLKTVAQRAFIVQEGSAGFSLALKYLADTITAMDDVLEQLACRLEALLNTPTLKNDAQLLQTIPGMSIKTSASFLSELGDWRRFSSADKALAWFGNDPAIAQSGLDTGQGRRLSKAGTKYGRRTMYLVALPFIRAVPQAKRKFKRLVRSGRSKREAVCIMAADLIKTCYAMLKSQSPFDPKKV